MADSPELQLLLQGGGFEQLVAQLLLPDNDTRKHAEAVFDQFKLHANPCALQLLKTLRTSPNVEHRSFSAIMLRKVRGYCDECDHISTVATPEGLGCVLHRHCAG